MLRIYNSTTSSDIKGYFQQSLSKEDYYSKDVQISGKWHGKLAAEFGLSGTIQQEDFYRLIDNQHPQTGEQVTERMAANRRVGYDLTFNAPKSVSLAYAATKDERILEAFNKSVQDTMQEVETVARTRVDTNGVKSLRETGNIVYGSFTHMTSRPEKDSSGIKRIDPHLHTHAYVFNMTKDREENRYKALENSGIKMNAPYFEASFHSRLAENLKELGYSIDRNGRYMELAGVERELIDKFSTRTSKIEKIAAKKGLSAKQKDQLGASTRKGKEDDLPFEQLQKLWLSRLEPKEIMKLSQLKSAKADFQPLDVKSALNHALSHELERRSVVKERRVMAEVLQQGYGKFGVTELQKEIGNSKEMIRTLIDLESHTTTKEAINQEIKMIQFAREGKGKLDPILNQPHQFKRDFLNEQQQNAVNHVLGSFDRVVLVEGGAGTGKTTLMSEVNEGIKKGGKGLFAFAPSAAASRGVLKDEGFINADTVASLLASKDLQEKVKNQVIWIDESGQVGTPTLNKVFELAKKQNARVLLTGDTKQHSAVERGDAMRLLQERAGLKVVSVREIQRQKIASYKEVVDLIQKGQIEKGINALEKNDSIVELSDKSERWERIANDYVKALKSKETVLVVSPTKKEGKEVTEAIRGKLLQNGTLGKEQQEFTVQKNLYYTEAQRKDSHNYQSGMAVQFVQNVKGGFKAGEKYDVVERKKGTVLVNDALGNLKTLPLQEGSKFQVFEKDTIQLAKGEKILITQNGSSKDGKRLFNGNSFEIKGFTKEGDIELTNKAILSKDHRNINYSYTSTSYSSQGKTVDRVLLAQGSESGRASSKEQFYVSVSRGRKSATIYTDNTERLKENVMKTEKEISALELKEESTKQKEQQKEQQKQQRAEKTKELLNSGKEKMAAFMRNARENMIKHRQIIAMRQHSSSRGR
ncbi:MAG: MobF family relaxase [Vicingaceae bacterium]